MIAFRQYALTICCACLAAGAAKLICPEGQLKPVINAVAALYILSTVLQLRGGAAADFISEISQTRDLPDFSAEMEEYADDIYLQAVVEQCGRALEENHIQATVSISGGCCRLVLENPEDSELARQLLQNLGWQGEVQIAGTD